MPGDTVGAIYVKVLTDSSGIKEQLEKEGTRGGSLFGEKFDRALSKEWTKSGVDDRIRERARGWAASISDEMLRNKDTWRIKTEDILPADEINDIVKRLKVPATQVSKTLKREVIEAVRFERALRDKALRDRVRAEEAAAKKIGDGAYKSLISAIEDYQKVQRGAGFAQRRFFRDLNLNLKDSSTGWGRMTVSFTRFRRAMKRAGTGGFFDSLTTGFGLVTFAAFKAVKGVTQAFGTMIKVAGTAVSKLGGPFTKLGDLIGNVGTSLFTAGTKGGNLAQMAITLAVALASLNVGLSAVAVLASTAAAGLVAVGGALQAVLFQATVLAPIFVSLGAGLAVLVIGAKDAVGALGKFNKVLNATNPEDKAEALKEYNEALKALGPNARAFVEAAEPMLRQLQGIQSAVSESLFDGMAESLKKVEPLLNPLKEGLVGIADAVGDTIDQFFALGQSSAFVEAFKTNLTTAETVVRSLGSAVTSVFSGLNSVFAAMAPTVERVVKGIENAAKSFEEWAQSAEGQTAISDFFTGIQPVVDAVWYAIKELGRAMFELFNNPATRQAATDLFTWIGDKLGEFADYMKDPKNQKAIAEWFTKAKNTAKALWGVVVAVFDFFQSLDTPENRRFIDNLIRAIGFAIRALGLLMAAGRALFAPFAAVFNGIVRLLQNVQQWIKNVRDWFDRLRAAAARQFANPFGGIIAGAQNALGWIRRLIENLNPLRGLSIPGLNNPRSGAAVLSLVQPTAAGGRTVQITNNFTLTTPNADARVVAAQVMNSIAASVA